MRQDRSRNQAPQWHAQFLTMLPQITTHARIAFRGLPPEAKAEKIQAVVCNALVAFVHLVRRGKAAIAYAGPLARFGVMQVRAGRQVGTNLNIHDLSSEYAQRMKGICLERLDKYDREEECWQEVLIPDRTCTPADLAASRIDFPAWLRTLKFRDRKVALKLAAGEPTSRVAKMFRLSDGRVSQLRGELHTAWRRFHGEAEPPEAAAVPA
jgi:hypothetical protein